MATKKPTKKDLEAKIADLEAKINRLSAELTKPAPKPEPAKLAEAPKPKPTEAPKPVSFQDALENAYRTAPMSDFHQYRAKVTGYAPAPNRYFVRLTAPVGTVPTSNWNDQKVHVTGYTQPSNQYFATRARLAYHPPDKTFGSFSGTSMSADGIVLATTEPAKQAKGTLPKGF